MLTDNIITVANLFEMVKMINEKIGYDYQAPLDEDTRNEITSSAIKSVLLDGVA